MNADNTHIEGRPADDDRLDSVIDAVAREMTDAEPSGALRARVLEGIEQTRRHRPPAVPRWAWTAATAMVVLAVATAVWMSRPAPVPGGTPATVAEQRIGGAAEAEPGARGPAAQPAGVSAAAASPAGTVAGLPLPGRAAAVRGAWAAEADEPEDAHPVLPALAEIEPLRFASVEPDLLQIAAVEVAPFPAIDSIDIPSLDLVSRDIQSPDPKKEQ
jgi:hypothetical protein